MCSVFISLSTYRWCKIKVDFCTEKKHVFFCVSTSLFKIYLLLFLLALCSDQTDR